MRCINCILCGLNDYKVIYKNKNDNFIKFSDNPDVISQKVICKSCSFIFQNPTFTEEELKRIYSAEYGINVGYGALVPTEKFLKEKGFRANDQLEWLDSVISQKMSIDCMMDGRRALEGGSSAGLLLNLLKKRGWQVEGVEPAERFADYARTTFGIKVYLNFLEEVKLEKSSYDLIILSHLLEHMSDPISILSKLASYLKPDGFLFIEIPNIRGIWKNIRNQLQSPHLFIPSLNTMQLLVAKAGLNVYKMEAKGRILRCLVKLPDKNTSIRYRYSDTFSLKGDNYKILILRLNLQILSSWLFKRLPFLSFLERIVLRLTYKRI